MSHKITKSVTQNSRYVSHTKHNKYQTRTQPVSHTEHNKYHARTQQVSRYKNKASVTQNHKCYTRTQQVSHKEHNKCHTRTQQVTHKENKCHTRSQQVGGHIRMQQVSHKNKSNITPDYKKHLSFTQEPLTSVTQGWVLSKQFLHLQNLARETTSKG